MSTPIHSLKLATAILAAIFAVTVIASNEAQASHPEQIGMKPGTTHKVFVSIGTILVEVIEVGKDGLVLVKVVSDGSFTDPGEKLWLNTNQVLLISPPLDE